MSRFVSSIRAFSGHLTRKQRNIFNFNPSSLAKLKGEKKLCSHFQVTDRDKLWNWMREQFLPNIYNQPWYNGNSDAKDMYIANKKSILIGMPWMRQLRIRNSKRCFKFSNNPEFSFFLFSSLVQFGRSSKHANLQRVFLEERL